jgi:Nicotinate-nucleotide pyrophosphorylase
MKVPLKSIDIKSFLEEDIGSGDITAAIIPETTHAHAEVLTREDIIISGQAWFDAVFKHLDTNVTINWLVSEGEAVKKNTYYVK